MDKFKLIAEVKRRPHLWRIPVNERDRDVVKNIWNEIAESLGSTEKMCRMEWKQLRSLYGRKKERREKLIQSLKRKGIYDANKNYEVKWIYFEPLDFLKVVFDANMSNSNSVDTKVTQRPLKKIAALKLIAEVKERKYLWRTTFAKRDKRIWDYLWTEVAERIGASEERIKAKWHELRRLYRKEKDRLDDNGNCDGTRKWKFYKQMKFMDQDSKITEVCRHPSGEIDKFRLIAEVKKRPYLWKKGVKGSIQLFNYFWSEVAEVFDVKVGSVRSKWNFLRRCYKDKYVALRRENLIYDESIVKNWVYFNHLKFLNIIFDAEYKFTTLDTNEADQNFDDGNVDGDVSDQHSNSSDSDTLDGYRKLEFDDDSDQDIGTESENENELSTTSSLNKQHNKLACSSEQNSINKNDLLEYEIKNESSARNNFALPQSDQLQHIESIFIKEEPQCPELTNVPIKSEESIKEEPETQQNDQFTIYTITEIKEEGGGRSLQEYETASSLKRINCNKKVAELITPENISVKEEPQFQDFSQ